MNFGEVTTYLLQGGKIRLPYWEQDVFIKARFPNENNNLTRPYVLMMKNDKRISWENAQFDLLSDDWEVVECRDKAINFTQSKSTNKIKELKTCEEVNEFLEKGWELLDITVLKDNILYIVCKN